MKHIMVAIELTDADGEVATMRIPILAGVSSVEPVLMMTPGQLQLTLDQCLYCARRMKGLVTVEVTPDD